MTVHIPGATEIELYSGEYIDLEAPDPSKIDPHDIATALSRICRYGGHSSKFFSVAQHTVLTAYLAEASGRDLLVKAALLHDAAEAYLGDVVHPLKLAMQGRITGRMAYEHLTQRMEIALGERFGIDYHQFSSPELRAYDIWAMRIEAYWLMPSRGEGWHWPDPPPTHESPFYADWIFQLGGGGKYSLLDMFRRWGVE